MTARADTEGETFIIAQREDGRIEVWRRKRRRYYFAGGLEKVDGTWQISGPRVAYASIALGSLGKVVNEFLAGK